MTTEATTRDRTPKTVTVRKVTLADAPLLSAAMARAFDDDPFVNWLCAQDKRRARRILDFMDVGLRKMTLPHGEVYTTDDMDGGAFWTPPGKWKLGIIQQLLLTPAMARSTTWKRIPTVISGISGVEKEHPSALHYYLMALGVEPGLQGKGIGTQLMAPVLEKADRERMPAYLESSKEQNIPLYERNGFKVTKEHTIKDGPKIWLMWRDPR